jgi:hypothetical protein
LGNQLAPSLWLHETPNAEPGAKHGSYRSWADYAVPGGKSKDKCPSRLPRRRMPILLCTWITLAEFRGACASIDWPGAVVRRAAGVPVPIMSTLYALLKPWATPRA